MRLFWLSLAAISSSAVVAAPPPPGPQAESATNIVFPGRTNEDDSRRGPPAAATVDTKEVREQGREKCKSCLSFKLKKLCSKLHISLEEVV